MTTSASANELFVETRRADAHTIVIVTGRVIVDSSPHLRPCCTSAQRRRAFPHWRKAAHVTIRNRNGHLDVVGIDRQTDL